ncbi:DUF2059 domain-containing protein [Mesonia maritima]|uniref:DUF2059 domain-containing protein n=1 Tax=Mesonia maritima TaxID=1793873 RepID=A0ABU1K9B7_9FLAO|nr:DUF2059 domain-containing protein [Mesonia maritima]MDR6302199.1 hypothetical protein [Mesonia maritima]
MKKLIFTLAIASISFASFAQEKAEKSTLEKELIEYIDAQSQGGIMKALDMFKERIPDRNKAAFEQELRVELKSFNEHVASFYMDELGEKDVQALVDFYNTPAGKRILEKTPAITEETMEYSQTWASKIQPIMQKYMNQ